ncbi:MAG: LysM peptidoglycan-binding domain-containing protein [Bdellovibrionota bacterium]
MRIYHLLFLMMVFFPFTNCITPPLKPIVSPFNVELKQKQSDEINQLITQVDADLDESQTFEEQDLAVAEEAEVSEEEIDDNPSQNDVVESVQNGVDSQVKSENIPVEINERVQKWIRYFSEEDRERFQRFLNRGAKYKERILEILADNEVPEELYYLAMIESGFVINAKSHAKAVGFWQFMKATGHRYGLKKNYYVDERQDPFRATMAAADYLKDLHRVFDSWYLAMAGYNAGEMRILRSIMKANSRNFWELARKKALPRETMNYVPKFLAASIIGRNPEKFGFSVPSGDKVSEVAMVDVPSPIKLKSVSDVFGISYDTLKELNPHLLRGMTPPTGGSYGIWVPVSVEQSVRDGQNLLAKHRLKNYRSVNYASTSNIKYHRVRRGENLTMIARKYDMPVWKLRRLNALHSSVIRVGERLKVRGGLSKSTRRAQASVKLYKVRRGDNLTKIAKKFGVSVSQIKRRNKIRRNRILAGQTLKIALR